MTECRHCGLPVPENGPAAPDFCCVGCQGAHALIQGTGLSQYYQRRCLDPKTRALKPEDTRNADFSAHVRMERAQDGRGEEAVLHLMVEGLHCAACVWLIESLLKRQPGVTQARLNMTTRRLTLRFRPHACTGPDGGANAILEPVLKVGYRLLPYDPALLDQATQREEKGLLRAMAVAGFASGNVMLFSVSIWFGGDMDDATRALFHWISALIAIPAILYAIRPFARSALTALRTGRGNMDVPITLAVLLAAGMSLWETANQGEHAYFDAAVMLLFFLLVGRYLDLRARGRARSAAEHLLALGAGSVTVAREDGTVEHLPPKPVETGATILVAAGERVGVDGTVAEGRSDLDTSLLTGETLPEAVEPGSPVFAGTVNLTAPLRIIAGQVGEGTLLAEIVRMMEVAEQGRARYVALADRVAKAYVPVVHLMALATFLGWLLIMDAPWQQALLIASAVLIVTCPCALALAVPVVQVIATGRLLRGGVLVKSPTALERLTTVDHVVFDKTGTLTEGRPELVREGAPWTNADLAAAAALAANSHHPLARALVRAAGGTISVVSGVEEHPGQGLSRRAESGGEDRLGNRAFCGLSDDIPAITEPGGPEIWFCRPGLPPLRFAFADAPRADARAVIATLKARGLAVELLSGDRIETVAAVAGQLGLDQWAAGQSPGDKVVRLNALAQEGKKVVMVGDGLNDAPALAAALVSLSPSTAVDVTQTAADMVFQGARLAPVLEAMDVAHRADRLVRMNFGLSFAYNVVTVPLAMAGLVTPLIAAVAMSGSSVVVILNALRLTRSRSRS